MTQANLHLPKLVEDQLASLAAAEGVSVDEFVSQAVQEKVRQFTTMRMLQARAAGVTRTDFDAALATIPDAAPIPGDELPEGWTGLKK